VGSAPASDGSHVAVTARNGSGGRHHVVVVGAGFGGLFATRRLKRAPVDVTVIDRTTHHLFQPLLYQVATGILSQGAIAPPVRDVLRHQRNARVVLGEVTDVDLEARRVTYSALGRELEVPYDSLIWRPGPPSRTSATTSSASTRRA
jgi:NADH dehydrogenase